MRHSVLKQLLMLACLGLQFPVLAADPMTGPVIDAYGPVFVVPPGSFNLEQGKQYRIVMDISSGPDDPADLNRNIESAARFLNMHARNGIKPENLQLAIVLHGSAAGAALDDIAHREHFGVPNGSKGLVEALGEAGVQFYLCGQSAGYRGYQAENLLPQVTMAVSAMTAHVRLQQEGFRAIMF
jgi:intracellular sulfur oxidation DsrE/DsrF family protein